MQFHENFVTCNKNKLNRLVNFFSKQQKFCEIRIILKTASNGSNIMPINYFAYFLTEISVCCSKIQVEAFIRDNELPTKILGRCPTCLYNFKRIFCDMMCSPNQSEFLNASQTVLAPNSNKEMVKVLDYHVSHEYADKAL